MLAPQAYPLALAAFASFLEAVSGITLDISTTGGNASSPILFGFMFEVTLGVQAFKTLLYSRYPN